VGSRYDPGHPRSGPSGQPASPATRARLGPGSGSPPVPLSSSSSQRRPCSASRGAALTSVIRSTG